MSRLDDFDMDTYRALLKHLGCKYNITNMWEYDEVECPYLVLRHDIDFCLKAAEHMAYVESRLGIRSSYLVSFSSPWYNPLEFGNIELIQSISDYGHDVGVHYDPIAVGTLGEGFLKDQIKILDKIIDDGVWSISPHNPSITDDPLNDLDGNAYRIARDENMLYVSDSCMLWDPFDADLMLNWASQRVMLLVHPEFWVYEGDFFDEIVSEKTYDLDIESYLAESRWRKSYKADKSYQNPVCLEMLVF